MNFRRLILPFNARKYGAFTAAVMGFTLLLLAQSLWRRKQVSWILAPNALLFSVPVPLFEGLG